MEYDQVIMADDYITKKDIDNPKNKISFTRTIEELNIYYVAATRARKAIELAPLDLHYSYDENEASTFNKPKVYRKKTSKKSMKKMQDEWLKKNRLNKESAF